MKSILILLSFCLFSLSVKSQSLVPLEKIVAEDDPKNLSYVLLRCASLELAMSFFPRDNVFSSEEDRFLANSTMSAELFNTVTEAHASNTGISLKEAKKFVGKHLFDNANLYLAEMSTTERSPFENTALEKDGDICVEMILLMGLSNSNYFNKD